VVVSSEEHSIGDLLAPEIMELIDAGENHLAGQTLMELLEPEIADVLITLEDKHRSVAFKLLNQDKASEVFLLLPAEEQERLLTELDNEQLANLFNEMQPDDRVQLFEQIPGTVVSKLLGLMKPEERRRTQIILGYPPESVGRIMTPDYLTVREDWTVGQALDHIRAHGGEVESFNTLFVVNDKGKLIDEVRLRQLILAEPRSTLDTVMDGQVVSLQATDDREQAVRVMERYDMPQLPVVDRANVLVGMVTFDDVADVAEQETTEDMQKLGGMQALEDRYLDASILDLVRKRVGWLAILFGGGLLTVSAMRFFNDEIQKYATLAFFVPLIIASGGNSGSQAATLMIRSLALGELKLGDWWRVFRRELLSGLLLGTVLGLIGMVVATLASLEVAGAGGLGPAGKFGFVVGTSVVGVVLIGTLVGSMLPFILSRFKLDPATSSTPFVATIVDVAGLVVYFGTAHVLLKLLM
jgi:magnesium transporter